MTSLEIEKLEQIVANGDATAIAHGEIFFEVDIADNSIFTSNGNMSLDGLEFSDINFYEVIEMDVEDDFREFIKDIKKSQKTIDSLNSKTMYIFKNVEDWITSEELLTELFSITFHIENPYIELYRFKQVRIDLM